LFQALALTTMIEKPTSTSMQPMKYLWYLCLTLATAFTAVAGPSTDAKDIQGTWIPVKAEMGGVPMGNDFLTNTVMNLDGGKYVVTVSGSPDKGEYTLDPASKPKTMDITGTQGPNTGRKLLCIYELDGNTLRICYGLGGSPRPTEFKSPSASKYFLVTYQRKK
jgi:uncharacterized protein (TIGR03067 family)